ncbi:MarR family transcriptional regulator [Kribbella monticola]|uniref:MarR family transcriptional regulator n=1 Tax=Kribbella monticola TaxID=2185285 RepID=UPI0018E56D65|nr:MarR family transcriptional regulator [Kribbella monticola]
MTATEAAAVRRRRRRLITDVRQSLRGLNNQLSLFNRHVSGQAELKDVDLDCLELLNLHGPISPTVLARQAGLHPATMTGVLDRLERGGWVTRERDPEIPDRRAIRVRALPDRAPELYELFGGMNTALDRICADYTDAELELITDFMNRTLAAARTAADNLDT